MPNVCAPAYSLFNYRNGVGNEVRFSAIRIVIVFTLGASYGTRNCTFFKETIQGIALNDSMICNDSVAVY
jgi:hypothetical protein